GVGSLLAFACGRGALSVAAYAVALLSKETAALLPAIVLLYGLLIARLAPRDAVRRTAGHWILLAVWAAFHPRLGGRLWAPLPADAHHAPGGLPIAALRTLLSMVNLDSWPKPAAGWSAALIPAVPVAVVFASVIFACGRSRADSPLSEGSEGSRRLRVAAWGAGWAAFAWVPLLAPGLGWHGYYALLGALG